MKDFSTAAVIRLIELGLKKQGLEPPSPIRTRGAHVPLQDKRHLLSTLLERHGPVCLLRIGEAIRDAPDEPILIALRLAPDPNDLLERWQRLERYAHSHHRTVCVRSDADRMILRHVSHRRGKPPLTAENLLVAGVLTGFAELIGTRKLVVRVGGEAGMTRSAGPWRGDIAAADTAQWEFSWQTQADRQFHRPQPAQSGEGWLKRARREINADPGRRWTVDVLARTLGASPRSLQRHLKDEGSSFSKVLASVRLANSAEQLVVSHTSPIEIGFACGYADQAHFNREFKRQTALTPLAYRNEFRSSAAN